ncbi:MFS transporter [Microtetraspora niveoalba]|uniref:MFS transporter n=1 Tax=Microtetraspora niveoalba TaxID=46175 RepID=UPI001C3F4072|nr:MFS transporter [Microtetraspora niveoalba]
MTLLDDDGTAGGTAAAGADRMKTADTRTADTKTDDMTAGDGEGGEAGVGTWRELLGPGRLGTALVLAGGVALYAVNVYVTTSLLPTAVRDIGGERFYAWNATFFLIASVISSMLVGRTLAARGPVGAYLVAFALFTAGTVVCAVSPVMELLLVGRAVQGLGGGLLAGLGLAVIRFALPPHLWTRGAALVSAMWGIGAFAGPAIGGLFAQMGSWRLAFGALALLAVVIAFLVPRALPRGEGGGTVAAVPVTSLGLLTGAAALVSVAGVLPRGALTAVAVAGALVLVALFLVHERRASVRVLPALTFSAGSPLKWIYLTIVALAIGSTAETFIPLFGQRLGGLAPLAAGFLGAALSLGWSTAQFVSANAVRQATVRRIRVAGPAVLAAGLALTALLQREDAGGLTMVLWVVTYMVAGAGIGMAFPHLATAVMGSTQDQEEAGRATTAINTVQLIASAFGSALAGVLVNLGEPSTVRSAHYLLGGFAVIALVGCLTARAGRSRG